MPEMDLNSFIGEEDEELEKAFGFTHYIETKDEFLAGKRVNSGKLVGVLFRFIGDQKLKVVKTDDGTILEIFDISLGEAKKNLILLQENKGPFYDEDTCINYSILGENFYAFAYGVLMFSASEENAQKMAKILDEYSIEYFEPMAIDKIKYIPPPIPEKKPGRNEPCYCGSGKKYKKCCWLKETKENEGEGFLSKGGFAEIITEKEEEKMKTFHKGHEEDMNFSCKKCNKKISAHSKDWHGGMCDECFNKEYFQN